MYHIECSDKFSSKLDIKNFFYRVNQLNVAGKKKIIYIKDVFEITTFRYRTYNVMEALENSTKYIVTCFMVEELRVISKLIDKIDLVILQRCKWSIELESFLNLAKTIGIKIVFDMDDLIYNNKYIPDYLYNIGDYTDSCISSLVAMVNLYRMSIDFCDEFIVSTPKLALQMEKDFKKKTYIYHNFLNFEQEEISKKICSLKEKKYDNSKFVIGYFSGSGTHARDLDVALDSILKLMNKYDDVYFEIVGFMALNNKFDKYIKNKRLIMKPLVTYQELQYLIGSVDLNIIPLQKNLFNDCKSELKFFEAAIVNTLTLASSNAVYGKVIEDGVNGFLVDDFDWFDKLEYIYLNRNKLKKIVDNARIYSLDEYGCSTQREGLSSMFDEIIS